MNGQSLIGLPVFKMKKSRKSLDLYAAYTLILSSQGGVSDVVERNYKGSRNDKACS